MPPAPPRALASPAKLADWHYLRAVIAGLSLALAGLPSASAASLLDDESLQNGLLPAAGDPPRAVDPRDLSLDLTYPRPFPDQPGGGETILLAQISEFDPNWRADAEPVSAPVYAATSPSFGKMFLKGWMPLTAAELALLGVTASLPKSWTGWSAHFVRDGINHMERAYTQPPVWDDDWWFHNYVGHPIGGSMYYNTVRSQGASPRQSMFFSAVLSTQWEYFFEAFAERPSIQDLVITPVAGSILGELSHRFTMHLKKGGTTTGEKLLILLTNPMHAAFAGF